MSLIDRVDFAELRVFLTIVRRQSFKAAAIELGLTPSAVSHAMARLEKRLGAKLLFRTSRSLSVTQLGIELAKRLEEGFDAIGQALEVINAPGAARFGELRINVFADAAHLMVAPALPEFAKACPDVRLTVVVDDHPIDIAAEGYDAGMRYGHHVPEEMVAVPVSGPQRWIVVAAPAYIIQHGQPKIPDDLRDHNCLQLMLGDNSRYLWELGSDAEAERVRTSGLITINDTATTITAAKAGMGLAYLLESRVSEELHSGSLVRVMDEFASPGDPFHIYYSSRKHNHPALRTLTNIIRVQNGLHRLR
ncbi:LysR family transcriptional regulator [Ochrobactrum sp. BTU2]|uniref:LysR family transcriptional regulator n=1 Tax=Ochrobactrum sp. BTU2 TaxID=2856166 RepID=UPI00211A35CF|nr:LysR family transcriptional regulator [Ochrobactrum sp. BTU2]